MEFSSPGNISSNESAFVIGQNDTEYLRNYTQLVYNIFSPPMTIIGIVGNVMVIWVILRTKDMRNSTNIFLANLAIADIMVLLVWGVEGLIDTNSERGILGLSENMCNALSFAMETVPSASVLTILAIGFERYYAVCEPLKAGYICTKSRAYKICILVWPIAVLFSSPQLVIDYQNVSYTDGVYTELICQDSADSVLTKAYFFISASLLYFIPLFILIVIYAIIARHLKGAKATTVNIAAIRHRRQVITLLATVILSFFLCHLPYRVFYLMYVLSPADLIRWIGVEGYGNMWVITIIMLDLHSVLNPILYNFMSKRFRAGFKGILRGIVRGFDSRQRGCSSREETTSTMMTTTDTGSSHLGP